MKKLNIKLFAILFVAASLLVSCASKPKAAPKATLTRTDSRLFWRIDGTDASGNPSTVYIQGTFHLGDERIFPLSEEVINAFQNADRWAGEMSTQAYIDLASMGEVLNAPNPDGKLVTDYLTEDEIAFLTSVYGDALPMLATLEPWQMSNGLSVLSFVNTGLNAQYGLDNSFVATLSQMGKEWEGMDELQVQLDVLMYGNYDEQVEMLKDNILMLTDEKLSKLNDEITVGLYEAYVANDADKMLELLNTEVDFEGRNEKLYDAYNKLVFETRNKDWAVDIANYLEEGGTTFIFVGSGHCLGDVSIFEFLKKNGTIK